MDSVMLHTKFEVFRFNSLEHYGRTVTTAGSGSGLDQNLNKTPEHPGTSGRNFWSEVSSSHQQLLPYMVCTELGVQSGRAKLCRGSLREQMAQSEPFAHAGPVPDTSDRSSGRVFWYGTV